MASAKPSAGPQRPVSPHLQIYSPLINMMSSIVHRITGVALYFGTLLLAWWLVAMAAGSASYAYASWVFNSPFGLLVLFGYTWALFHHMLGGVRHLIWDTGRGFDLDTVDRMCWFSIFGSVSLTILVWAAILFS
jgi:succinate dehydrogenase / fumarate reductase, cytochrome b subunit